MEIEIQLPAELECDNMEYDKATRTVRFTPLFTPATVLTPIATVAVKGEGGASRKFITHVSGNSGRLITKERLPTANKFDGLEPDSVPTEDDEDDEDDELLDTRPAERRRTADRDVSAAAQSALVGGDDND